MDESTIDRLVERIDKLTGFMERREVETLSPYLTTQEAADYLKVSKRTIERMIKSNQIKYYPINQEKNRSKYLIKKKDLDAYLEHFAKEPKYEIFQRAVNGGRGRR
jgi:excisionase family DNA binding protein